MTHITHNTFITSFGTSRVSYLEQIAQQADEMTLPVFLIGGSVRDLLLSRPHTDIDIAVEGDAPQFANHLAQTYGGHVHTHDHFQTATWINNEKIIDIASCRKEYYDHPGALPRVTRSSLTEDLARRDFSINALAVCLNCARFGELIDLYHGHNDLQTKTIRVLHPKSFQDDPTRIFRAVRFALRLDFQLDPATVSYAKNVGDALHMISADRLYTELERLAEERGLYNGSRMLDALHVWHTLFGKKPTSDAWNHVYKLNEAGKLQPFELLLALSCGAPLEKYERTKIEKRRQREWRTVSWDKVNKTTTQGELHQLLAFISDKSIIFAAYALSHQDQTRLLTYVQQRKEVTCTPLLSGKDLQTLGHTPGPHFSHWLFALTCAQLNGEVTTKKEATTWLSDYIANQ
ncbi:hypothetical protein NSQ26_08655 [Bacillus sp. FSL W7-1360]